MIVAGAASALAFVLFLLLAWSVLHSGLPHFAWDLTLARAVQAAMLPRFENAMHAISWPGDYVLWSSVIVATACCVLVALRQWREAVLLLGLVLLGQLLKIGVKQWIDRPRPRPDLLAVVFDAHEVYSFPSGHTVHYTILFGFLFYVTLVQVRPMTLRWLLLIGLGGFVVLVGLSRVAFGPHWPSDILGGYLLGGGLLAAGIGLHRWWLCRAAQNVRKDRSPANE